MPISISVRSPSLELWVHKAPTALRPPPQVSWSLLLGMPQFWWLTEPKRSWVPELSRTSKWVRVPLHSTFAVMVARRPPWANVLVTVPGRSPPGIGPPESEYDGSVAMPNEYELPAE